MADEPQNDPRVYFAAERTLLAWLRTGLGLMGVGFAVARFGLFLREMQTVGPTHGAQHAMGLSAWAGVALVALGVLVNVSAVVNHVRVVRQMSAGTWQPGRISTAGIVLAVILAAIGTGMAAYLVLAR
jgi:putative membrane protein